MSTKLPIILAIILYLLFFSIRYQQGGWDIKLDLFKSQRDFLDQKISQLLPIPQSELLSGILLGQNKNLPGQLKLALRDTSTLHIVVVSGQNLTLLASFLLNLSGLIKKKNAIVLSVIAIIFYTLLTGAQVPVLRAAVMVTLASLAQLFGRQKDALRILAITALLMLLINPKWLVDISFQLSFLATLGILVVAPILEKVFERLPNLIKQDLAITIAAQLLVMPVILQNFHQLSLVSVFANLLVSWTIPFIMILGSSLLIFSFISVLLGQVVAFVLNILLTYFVYIVEFFASLPFAWEYIGEQVWVVWVGYYMVVGGAILALNNLNIKNKNVK